MFSSFSYDAILLLRQGSFGYFLLYVFGSVALSLIATAVGTRKSFASRRKGYLRRRPG
jgi:fluoride ion exporter CrcB/FEX